MNEEMTKGQLLDKIHQERERFEETIVKLTKDQMMEPGLEDGWSVKDILGHISVWENRIHGVTERILEFLAGTSETVIFSLCQKRFAR